MTQPLRISMIISADAKGVSPATAETRRELRGVSEAAQETAKVLTFVSAANDRYEASARRAADAARGQSAAERQLRDTINSATGVRSPLNDNALRERAADIDVYGAAMDRMRARFNPVFAVIQNYKAQIAEIRQAHAVGAIGIDEMTAALGRERQAALASIAALKGRGSAVGNVGPSSFNTANIAAQVQDIGVTTAMGMSPLQIALQQGTQLSAVFEEMRGRGQNLGSALFAAFTSVISPVSLLTIGVIAAGTALAQYFMTAKSGAQSVDDIIARHEENIRRLGPAYEEVAKKARAQAVESVDVVDQLFKDDAKKAADKVASDVQAAVNSISLAAFRDTGSKGGGRALRDEFSPFGELISELKAGEITVVAFREKLTAIGNANPRFAETAAELRKLTNEAASTYLELNGMPSAADRVGLAFSQMQAEIDKINPYNASGRLADVEKKASELFTRARTGQIDMRDLNEELRMLGMMNPDLSPIINELLRVSQTALQTKAALEGLATTTPKTHRLGAMDALGESFDDVLAVQRRMNPDLFNKIDPDKLKKTRGGRASKADPYRDLIKSADDRIKQLKVEIELTGRAGAEAEALRYEQELLSQATDKGRSIDEKQLAQIKAKAKEYGNLKIKLAEAKVAQDLMFERDQLFRSPVDQRIAATMRSAGLEVDLNSAIADQIRWNEHIATTRDLFMDVTSGIVGDLNSALEDGKITWDEWAEIGLNALSKIADQLLSMATNGLFSSLFGGLFGGGASNFGSGFNPSPTGFMDMLGLAKGGAFHGDGSIARFAKGGAFTNTIVDRPTLFSFANGSKFGEMGEAGAEAVMPLKRDAAGRLGVLSAGNDNGGGANGGRLHVSVGVAFEGDGGFRAYVKDVAQTEGANAAVTVVRENNQARENYYQNGGRG